MSADADIPLLRMRKDPNELRSHRFFMEVTAPSVAGALNTDFWLYEIPRVCHNDEAIWHAVVSLGSAHEAYVSGVAPKPGDSVFTLQHFNAAIQCLTGSYSAEHWWRALTVSAIFTSICCLEGKFEEARMHFKYGYNLLNEFDNPNALLRDGKPKREKPNPSKIPVSIGALRSVLIAFEMRENKISAGRVSKLPSLLSQNDNFMLWASYVTPRYPPAFGNYINPDNLSQAIRNSESLFMALLFSSLQHANNLKKHYVEGRLEMLTAPGPSQEPLLRCFGELEKTLKCFQAELDARPGKGDWRRGETHLRQAYLCLSLMQTTNRFLLRHDPDEPDGQARLETLPTLCDNIVKLATKIMNLEKKHGCIRSGSSIANPTVLNPVAIVAKSGFCHATRKRAVQLLRRPRLEGVWDSLMVASFADAIVQREMAATKEYNMDPTVERIAIDDFTARGWSPVEGGSRDDVHPMARVLFTAMEFTGGRQARLELRTWREWLEGTPSQSVWIYW